MSSAHAMRVLLAICVLTIALGSPLVQRRRHKRASVLRGSTITAVDCTYQSGTCAKGGTPISCTDKGGASNGYVKCDDVRGQTSTFCTGSKPCGQFDLVVKQGSGGNQLIGNLTNDDPCSGSDACGMSWVYNQDTHTWSSTSNCTLVTQSGKLGETREDLNKCIIVTSTVNCINITNTCSKNFSHYGFECTLCRCDCTSDNGQWLKSCQFKNSLWTTVATWTWNQGYGACDTLNNFGPKTVDANTPSFVADNTGALGCPIRVTFSTPVDNKTPCGDQLPKIEDDCYALQPSCPS